jgi:hypothetical protein
MVGFNPFLLSATTFGQHTDPLTFIQQLKLMSHEDKDSYLRQRMTEGIPFVFHYNPLLYESIRTWLAKKINIHPKDITLIGSGRTGFSFAPPPDFGKKFSDSSDIDLTIISSEKFEKLVADFEKWKNDLALNMVAPKNKKESDFWSQNIASLPGNINRGFIDTYKIPNLNNHAAFINNALWELGERLNATPSFLRRPKISSRVYKDWRQFTRQFMLNADHTLSKITDSHLQLLKMKGAI